MAWRNLGLTWIRGIFRAALKQLKQERIKKYEYCLPCEFATSLSSYFINLLLGVDEMVWMFQRYRLPNCAFVNIGVICGYILANGWWAGRELILVVNDLQTFTLH
jgi:hypothetical protein